MVPLGYPKITSSSVSNIADIVTEIKITVIINRREQTIRSGKVYKDINLLYTFYENLQVKSTIK